MFTLLSRQSMITVLLLIMKFYEFIRESIMILLNRVNKELGPGLLESVYQSCMIVELKDMNITVHAEVPVPIFYHGQKVSEEGFRLDLLVEDTVVVELKSMEKVKGLHKKQLLLAP